MDPLKIESFLVLPLEDTVAIALFEEDVGILVNITADKGVP